MDLLWLQRRHHLLFMVLAVLAAIAYGTARRPAIDVSWWVWAGITLDEVPADVPVYLYQGLFSRGSEGGRFEPRGYFPHSLAKSDVALVFRFDDLVPVEFASHVINRRIERWRRHGTLIREVQFDFDSPTARLSDYAEFLARLRPGLPAGTRFTVTGLGSWLFDGKREDFAAMYRSIDAIVFQLYRNRDPVDHVDWYLKRLTQFEHPFKVGLLPTMGAVHERLSRMNLTKLRGITYFYQRR